MAYKKSLYKEFKDIKNLDDVIETYVDWNVRLINGVTEDITKKLTKRITSGLKKGKSNEEIAKSIKYGIIKDKGIFKTIKNRTKLIANDQIGKLNADLTKLRMKFNKVEKYVWRTRLDERVRDEHAEREGEVFSWDKPPEGGHPGEEINCRCWSEPYIEEEIEE